MAGAPAEGECSFPRIPHEIGSRNQPLTVWHDNLEQRKRGRSGNGSNNEYRAVGDNPS